MWAHQASNLLPASTAQQARVRERTKTVLRFGLSLRRRHRSEKGLSDDLFVPSGQPNKKSAKQDICSKRQLSYGRLLQHNPPPKVWTFAAPAMRARRACIPCGRTMRATPRAWRAKRVKTSHEVPTFTSLPPPPSPFGKKVFPQPFCAFNAAERAQLAVSPTENKS